MISGCNVWCWLLGFFLGSMVMYLCKSHSILVSKFCTGGCRKLVRWVRLFWEKRAHSHYSLSVVMVAKNRSFWSYMWDFEALVCMVGLLVTISLFGLHYCVDVVRLVILSGGVCVFCLLFGCSWDVVCLGWLVVYGWCDGIFLLVGGCVLIGCYPGVRGLPLCTIVVWCPAWWAIDIGIFSWWLVRHHFSFL